MTKTNLRPSCDLCGKTAVSGYNRPKSLHKTKRVIKPNLQKWNDLVVCNRCRRTLAKATQKPVSASA